MKDFTRFQQAAAQEDLDFQFATYGPGNRFAEKGLPEYLAPGRRMSMGDVMSGGLSRYDSELPHDLAKGADKSISSSLLQESHAAMNGHMLEHKLVITSPQGFHLRPMSAFAQAAGRFQSEVSVRKDDKRVNGKSPLELMLLAAEQGTELIVEVTGPDAREALDAIVGVMTNLSFEDENSEPPLPKKG